MLAIACRNSVVRPSAFTRLGALQQKIDRVPKVLLTTSPALRVNAEHSLNRMDDAESKHSSVGHWKVEKLLSVASLAAIPVALAVPCLPLDFIMSAVVLSHGYMGLQSVVFDYLHYRPKVLYKTAQLAVLLLTALGAYGLMYMAILDGGIAHNIRKFWSTKAKPKNQTVIG